MSGFVMLPLRKAVLDGDWAKWDDRKIAVFPVLIAHANKASRVAIPSQARIAILAGVSKTTVAKTVNELEEERFLSTELTFTQFGRTRTKYRMEYAPYKASDRTIGSDKRPGEAEWLRVDSYLILKGHWATMPPSVRRLFLVLIANSRGNYGADYSRSTGCWDDIAPLDEGRFVDARYLDPGYLRRTTQLTPRTFKRAWDSLLDTGLMRVQEGGQARGYKAGVLLIYEPTLASPKILARITKQKEEAAKPSNSAMKLLQRGCRVSTTR